MKVDEFYEHIVQYMTPEEALKKLLATSVEQYTELSKYLPEAMKDQGGSPYFIIAFAAIELGWQLAVEKDQKNIRGLMVGTPEYMDAQIPEMTWIRPPTLPKEYGEYIVTRAGKVHFEIFNGSGWAYNGNTITGWMKKPSPLTD